MRPIFSGNAQFSKREHREVIQAERSERALEVANPEAHPHAIMSALVLMS